VRRQPHVEDLLRPLAPRVLGVLARRHGQWDLCEDAVQEALLAASRQWPDEGVPDNPYGWLLTVATRRLTDHQRADAARRRREEADFAERPGDADRVPAPGEAGTTADEDDALTLLFLCCHPAISSASQLALTLRAVGGLTTDEVAAAFLVPETTMAQRISRAKQRIRAAGVPFRLPPERDRAARLRVVLHVLYLMFNEGYTATSGPALHRTELTTEAIRIARLLHARLPRDGEATGLLALMLLTDARRPARTTADGALVPLDEQDRRRWDAAAIDEGVALVTDALSHAALGPYQLQAAIAAVHDEAPTADATDWPQILALYERLRPLAPDNPMVALSHAVAVAMVAGPQAGLEQLAPLADDPRMAEHHRLDAVRGHLCELAGDPLAAGAHYRAAARRTTSLPERRYLEDRAARLDREPPPTVPC
jgi:RNA polymerase sigma factor (sigma-70 family)